MPETAQQHPNPQLPAVKLNQTAARFPCSLRTCGNFGEENHPPFQGISPQLETRWMQSTQGVWSRTSSHSTPQTSIKDARNFESLHPDETTSKYIRVHADKRGRVSEPHGLRPPLHHGSLRLQDDSGAVPSIRQVHAMSRPGPGQSGRTVDRDDFRQAHTRPPGPASV